MYSFVIILVVLASVLMCCIVLIQESKGGGLAADYSSNNQILGAPKTTNFVEKATWYLAGAMIFFSVISVSFLPKHVKGGNSLPSERGAAGQTVNPGIDQSTGAPATAETQAADVQQ